MSSAGQTSLNILSRFTFTETSALTNGQWPSPYLNAHHFIFVQILDWHCWHNGSTLGGIQENGRLCHNHRGQPSNKAKTHTLCLNYHNSKHLPLLCVKICGTTHTLIIIPTHRIRYALLLVYYYITTSTPSTLAKVAMERSQKYRVGNFGGPFWGRCGDSESKL